MSAVAFAASVFLLVATSHGCATSDCAAARGSALLQVNRQEKIVTAELKATPGTAGQFLYQGFRLGARGNGRAEHVYRMEGDTLTVESIEPHVVRNKGGKQYEIWNTSSPILSSLIADHAAKGEKISMVPVGLWAQQAVLSPNTPEVFVSLLHISELDQYYYYMFEAQPPFRILGMGEKPLPPAFLQTPTVSDAVQLFTIQEFLPSAPARPEGLTLIMLAHKRDRLPALLSTVGRYRESSPDLLHEIVLIWNNQTDPGTVEMLRQNFTGGGVPVRVLETDANSMNNRFAVWEALQTEGIVIQDDDMWFSLDTLKLLVDAWRQQPDQLFGAFLERVDIQIRHASDKLADAGTWENNSYHWKEVTPKCTDTGSDIPDCVFSTFDYSMLLPHPWVLSQKYLKEYMKHPTLTQLVDDMVNCDDIYLNAVVANATRAPPIALDIPVHRFPEWQNENALWVSSGDKWLEKRSRCLEEVNSIYAGQSMNADTGAVWRRTSNTVIFTKNGVNDNKSTYPGICGRFEVADGPKFAQAIQLWGSLAAASQAKALSLHDTRTAIVSSKVVESAARLAVKFAAANLRLLNLHNPSLIKMPVAWRQPGEMWLAVFRSESTEFEGKEDEEDEMPTWYASQIVLAVLDSSLKLVRPLNVLASHDFFSEPFDCQMSYTNHSYFGPEDARIFAVPEANGMDSQVLLFFTAREHFEEPNMPCSLGGGQRMYVASVGSDLRPISSNVILVQGESSDMKDSVGRRASGPDSQTSHYPSSGHLAMVEKNWSPFIYASAGGHQVLLEYSIDPHIVMTLDVAGHRAGDEGLWQTSSPHVKEWLQQNGFASVHGGVGAILLELPGKQKLFLSILHTLDPLDDNYRSFLFTFEAEPPFAITGISGKELPLQKRMCSWGADVAFATQLHRMEGGQGSELWVMYGSGDTRAHRLVLPWDELHIFLPESHSAADASSSKEVISTDTGSPNEDMTHAAADETARLLGQDLAWHKKLLLANSTHSADVQTREIISRMDRAIAEDSRNVADGDALDSLYNPSVVEIPAAWRRSGEKWLAVFRQKHESNETVQYNEGSDAGWYSFSFVMTILDADFKPLRPPHSLRSSDFFNSSMDCQLTGTNTSYFGPSDARLFLDPKTSDPSSAVLLFFSARLVGKTPNTPCPTHAGQRMFVARIDENLNPVSTGPILVEGEHEELPAGSTNSLAQQHGSTQEVGVIPGVGPLKPVEKNWAPFVYEWPRGVGNLGSEALVEYSIEPHVVMDLDLQNRHAGKRHVWHSTSLALQAWLARRNAAHTLPVSKHEVHGGVGALLVEVRPGGPKAYLSVLHFASKNSDGQYFYQNFLYFFSPEPPFRILGVGDTVLPLVSQPCRWGALVAFPMQAIATPSSDGDEFWLFYGSGDSQARRWVTSWKHLQNFLPVMNTTKATTNEV